MELINHYEEAGAGEPLILLHGNGESCEYFSRQISYFKENYRVIAVDTRGHGKSPRGTAPFTIRQFADDLYAFMRRRGIDKAHILGFSDGGNIALTFVLRYPACVDRLILNGANLYFSGMYAVVCIPVYLRYLFWRMFRKRSETARKNAEVMGLMVNDPALRPEQLFQIRQKTLVIAGTRDMTKKSHTELIARSIPNAELKFLKGDHFIAAKKPDEFNREVGRFLRERESGRD